MPSTRMAPTALPYAFLAATILSSVSSVCGSWGHVEYAVSYVNDQIEISVQGSHYHNTAQTIPNLNKLGVFPLVQLSSCKHRTTSEDGSLFISHSLLTQVLTWVDSKWSIQVPGYLEGETCVEVYVQESVAGTWLHVPSLRRQVTIAVPPQLSDSSNVCYHAQCVIIASSWFGWTTVSLVHDPTEGGYSLVHDTANGTNESAVIYPLPHCIVEQITLPVVSWSLVDSNTTCSEESFIPTHVYAVSKRDVFVRGNGLIYSPDNGLHFYELTLPNAGSSDIVDFTATDNGKMFALVRAGDETVSATVWFGFTGSSIVLKLYPSSLLDTLWDIRMTNFTLDFDDRNRLFLVAENSTIQLPLALLLSQSSNQISGSSSLSFTSPHTHPLLHTRSHPLTHHTFTCPYHAVTIEASVCELITRTKHHLTSIGALRWSSTILSAETNCTVMGDYLPGDIFLGQSESYHFRIHFLMSPAVTDPTDMQLVGMTSDPGTLLVHILSNYSAAQNTLTFDVELEERGLFNNQRVPGSIATSTDVTLKVPESSVQCLDELSDSIHTPDTLEMRVHVGCPPGISLTFDPVTTSSQFDQYCNYNDNISCYYFGQEFKPVFKVVDEVTDTELVYTGPYTLRALAGGVYPESMREFVPSKNVESSIWTPVNSSKKDPFPVYYHGDSAIKWVCGTSSPCGEILPQQTSQYYILLQATNLVVDENSTYCNLSVQFTIQIHGLGMGAITTVVALMVFLTILVASLLLTFLAWHYRLKFIYWKDLILERQHTTWTDTRQRITDIVRKHKASSTKNKAFL